ncbi:MAG TPA: ABC transporter permease [Pyrinomonadaceae bacterium]|nr:ABC transporter permease [Pyrinomonadaceae bacterium]
MNDIRYALRSLIKRPGFTAIALITLALGIGANTAIFSLVNTVLLRPLPVPQPEQVASVAIRGKNDSLGAFSHPNFKDFRERNQVLEDLLVYRFAPLSLSRDGNNERVWSYEVSGNYFDTLGVQALMGRTFLPEEDQTRLTHPVIVLSYDCWQKRFGADPDIVGKQVLLNNRPFEIIGIAPEGFKGTELIYAPDVFVPLAMLEWTEPGARWLDDRDTQNLFAIGRLKAGISQREAEASLNVLAQQLAQEYPLTNEGQSVRLTPPGLIIPDLREGVVSFTWILMGTVLVVLLITCINLAGLLLARATDRRKEIAIRLALGANRRRLIRQLLTESTLLSMIGGALGFGLAHWMVGFLIAFRPPVDFPLTMDISMDWRVLIFALTVSLLTGALFGLAPALQSTRLGLTTALKETGAQAGYGRSRLRSSLVVAQLGFSLMLLIGAGLVTRTLQNLQTLNPGFDTKNTLFLSFDLGLQGYDRAKAEGFYRQAIERVEALPGIESAVITDFIPLNLGFNSSGVYIEGQPSERGSNVPIAMLASVGSKYFSTMGTPLLFGREITDQDREDIELVAVVNETFVRHLLPDVGSTGDAIGRRFSVNDSTGPFRRIVGIARDGKYFNIAEDARPFVWLPLAQSASLNARLIARTSGDPRSSLAAVTAAIRSLDQTLPLYEVKTMSEHMRLALFPARIAATVLGAFGVVALTLAAIGIYGVTSYTVAQRTREIGIRMALGAQFSDVLRLILGHGVKLTLVGVVIGLAGAILLTSLLESVLYGVSATDPLTFVITASVLILVALLSAYLPARRATKVDPLVALRYE